MEIVKMKLADLEPNAGQIEGLPINPRQWTKSDIDSLARSLKETPELFEARPIIAVPHGDKFVILGGNLRYEASKQNKAKEVPCVVLPADMPIDKMKEIVIKDNGSFGDWDMDALANEWDDLPLAYWGVPTWGITPEEGEEINDQEPENEDGIREEYSASEGKVTYEPKETNHKISDLYDDNAKNFDEMLATIKNQELQKMLRLRAAWFVDFHFNRIADYYAYQATPEEQRVFEALGLVLLDREKLIENGFADLLKDFKDEANH